MSKKDEALKLALEALDCIYSPLHVREINKVGAAMAALREALAEQPAQQPVACLVETEQGVMLWPIEDINEAENYCEENEFPVLLYTSSPAQKKSAAWTLLLTGEHHGLVGKAGEKFVGHPEHYERVDVYTSPQRTWVGLTFGQFHNILQNHKDIGSAMGAVEKTLREQNT